jgi:hypothetical protein
MDIRKFILILMVSIAPVLSQAQDVGLCKELFPKDYKVKQFAISVEGKKQSDLFLRTAHQNLVTNEDPVQLKIVLEKLSTFGVEKLSDDEIEFIFKFRQNSSLLRSIFQTSEKNHESPSEFGAFVKDFGVLKDYLLMKDNVSAQSTAEFLLERYADLDFVNLLKDSSPAGKKSVALYFIDILKKTKKIMKKQSMRIDEVHTVRKNLRDILRFLQLEKDLSQAKNKEFSAEKDAAINFLKKINTKLGLVCDDYAAQILGNQFNQTKDAITKKSMVEFPLEIRPRVQHFLNSYSLEISE